MNGKRIGGINKNPPSKAFVGGKTITDNGSLQFLASRRVAHHNEMFAFATEKI